MIFFFFRKKANKQAKEQTNQNPQKRKECTENENVGHSQKAKL